MSKYSYNPKDFGEGEMEMMKKYYLQVEDAKGYFKSCIKPRLDRSYKLYISDNSDRAKEIQSWQANIFVPYTHAVVETLVPRIIDARPDFGVIARKEENVPKAVKLQHLTAYTWEVNKSDRVVEDVVRGAAIYGLRHMQVGWRRDEREYNFLKSKDVNTKKYIWKKKKQVFYDAPFMEDVDNYSLWYDWHNIKREDKQFWFKRLLLTGAAIKVRYPSHDKDRLALAFKKSGDLTDFADIRNRVKFTHEKTIKGADYNSNAGNNYSDIYSTQNDPDLKMHEVFEWYRPYEDKVVILVNDVPILNEGEINNVYDFKETPFIDVPFLRAPGEYEGYGVPLLLENPQLMLNLIKNQRLDETTLSIHKMWIVNPLANINKDELVTRPFGIIYSPDPNGVREVQFGDVKASAYKEEELLKGDMRYASGVDDFSMGVGGGASSATEIRHLRESTLERVRLFVNHLGDAFSIVMRDWFSLYKQFWSDDMQIRIVGTDGKETFPLIQKDDLEGEYDFKATVLPSVAGQNDIDKKQGMDLLQLLIGLPFVDQRKLVSKLLRFWNWDLNSIEASAEEASPLGSLEGELPAEAGPSGQLLEAGSIPPDVARAALAKLGTENVNFVEEGGMPFGEAAAPINLLQAGAPPTPKGVPMKNLGGLNRGGRVNTNINVNQNSNPESALLNRTFNTQR